MPSLVQCRLLIGPQSGRTSLFTWVTWSQLPIAPAQISGGCDAEWRMTADIVPSALTEASNPQPPALITSALLQSCVTLPEPSSTVPRPASPSMCSANRILSGDSQLSQLGEAAIPGVTFRAAPPAAGTTKMSPPVAPSSLIKPAMKATSLPSGDQRGTAN